VNAICNKYVCLKGEALRSSCTANIAVFFLPFHQRLEGEGSVAQRMPGTAAERVAAALRRAEVELGFPAFLDADEFLSGGERPLLSFLILLRAHHMQHFSKLRLHVAATTPRYSWLQLEMSAADAKMHLSETPDDGFFVVPSNDDELALLVRNSGIMTEHPIQVCSHVVFSLADFFDFF
jgi:hypothetical protein